MAANIFIRKAFLLLMVSSAIGRRIERDVSELKGYYYEKPSKPFPLPPSVDVHEDPTHLPQELSPPEEYGPPVEVIPEEPVVPQDPEEIPTPEHTSEPENPPDVIVQDEPTNPPPEVESAVTAKTPSQEVITEEPTEVPPQEVIPEEPTGDGSVHHLSAEEHETFPPQDIVPPEEGPAHSEELSIQPEEPEIHTKAPAGEEHTGPPESITHHPEEYLPPLEEGTHVVPLQPETPNENVIQGEEYLPPDSGVHEPISEYGTPIAKPCNVKSGRINCEIPKLQVTLDPEENNEYLPPDSI